MADGIEVSLEERSKFEAGNGVGGGRDVDVVGLATEQLQERSYGSARVSNYSFELQVASR